MKKKSVLSSLRGKTGGMYTKVDQKDEGIEMVNFAEVDYQNAQPIPVYKGSDVKPHEIYENT